MDCTNLFRASCKTVLLRNKRSKDPSFMTAKPIRPESCPFTKQASQVVHMIGELQEFLIKHRKEYINFDHLMFDSSRMSDLERDQIDTESERIIKNCNQLSKSLRNAVRIEDCSPQLYKHRQAMAIILDSYLKSVCKIYTEQKAVRVKKASDMKRLSRLGTLVTQTLPNRKFSGDRIKERSDSPTLADNETIRDKETKPDKETIGDGPSVTNKENELRKRHSVQKKKTAKAEHNLTEKWGGSAEYMDEKPAEMNMRPEERTQLEKENRQVFEQMNSMEDEMVAIEGKVMEIARLQEVLSEKVLEQEEQIYTINEVAIHTTENIKSGNEQIREAMKRKAGYRVYILFFLIVMSFTLLFLDWYNA